jgi:DNA modification methylase
MNSAKIYLGDVRKRLTELDANSIQTCITSPPYWGLRDYGHGEQIGLEQTPQDFVESLVSVFREVKRVLKDDGTLWLNLGDSYASAKDSKASPDSLRTGQGTAVATAANRNPENLKAAGIKNKDLVGIPWRVAFALQADGWYLRQDIIWAKPNPMPESVKDRCTKSHEYVFLLSKSPQYFFNNQAIKEIGTGRSGTWSKKTHEARIGHGAFKKEYTPPKDGLRNKRDVWFITTKPFKGAHFAVMPEALVEPCVLAGTKMNDFVLDPFTGSGTVAIVALKNNRNFIGFELNCDYVKIAEERITNSNPMFHDVEILREETVDE